MTTRFIKIHCAYDDRKPDRSVADRAEFANKSGVIVQIFQKVGWREEFYQYDAVGDRTQESIKLHSLKTYDYIYYKNSTRLAANGRYAYVYDGNGNMIRKSNKYVINGTTETANGRQEVSEDQVALETLGLDTTYWEYEYDLMNRMVQAKKNGQVVASYVYDPTGLRIKKTGSAGTYRYVYSGMEVILKVDMKNSKQSRYIYVLGKSFAREDVDAQNQTTKTYFVTDIEGNIVQATDEKGNSKWKRDFLPFGMSTSEEGNVDEEAGFTGKDYDADVEMTYFNARWYDPELGRFVEEDPMADDPNLYSYGFNSPLNYMDPTGMFSVGITGLSNGNYLQFAGAVVGAIGQLNPKYADICSAFGAFLSIVDNRQQVAKAKIAAEKAAEQEAELSANIITAGIDRHKSNPKNDGSFSVDILDTSEANDDTLGVEVEILPGGYTRVEAEEAIPLDLGLDLNLYNTEDNGAGFFNDSLIENSNDWIAADVTYYNQHDSPWGDDLYSIKNDWKNQTFSKSGCGPTAAAMAISTQLGIRFTPDVAGQFSLARGYRTLDSGTNPDFFQPLGKACGLNVIATTSFDQLIYYLGKGGTAVVSMKPGDFTTGGHYIVLSAGKFGTNNGSRLFVSDPNKREKTKYWNSSVIKKQMKGNYYIFISDERLFTSSFD